MPSDCKNCEFLQQQNEQLCKEIEELKAQLLKVNKFLFIYLLVYKLPYFQ